MTAHAPHHRVAIAGAGFAGLGMAIRLKQAGMNDFVVLERADDLGGTWRDNTYPGCACDVPSRLYSFSFAPNLDWSHAFSPQPEIWSYLRRCAEEFGVLPHLRFGHEVLAAEWDEEGSRWEIETTGGRITADVAVSGTGALSEPSLPQMPGLESFEGPVFHSATWDHDVNLEGKRVAVIGTGASAIQFVPQIQPKVDRLHLFQRTPPWIVPRRDRAFSPRERSLLQRFPVLERLIRGAIYWSRESLVLGFGVEPRMLKAVELLARAHLARQVANPELRAKLTPDYRIGCKRILLSDDFYPAVSQPNVDLVTAPVREIGPRSVVTQDGSEREVDAVIVATGFHVTDPPIASRVRGRHGELLADVWRRRGQDAFRGTTIAGFPNFFMIVGPNTGLGHSSMVFMIESQIAYVMDALRFLESTSAAVVEVRDDAMRAFNHALQRRMRRTVWLTGCRSWYLDQRGRNTTLWPKTSWAFRRLTRRFDPVHYRVRRAAPARIEAPEPELVSVPA